MKNSLSFIAVFLLASVSLTGAAPDPEQVLVAENATPKGHWIEKEMPQTLDLAERATLAVNALTGILDPANNYAAYQIFKYNQNPPQASVPSGHQWKHARALPLMRQMSGSEQNLQVDLALMRLCLDSPYVIRIWQERDGNPAWHDWIENFRQRYRQIYKDHLFLVEDRAYFPPEGDLQPDGSWKWTDRGPALVPYQPPDEPVSDQQGFEGAVKWAQTRPLNDLLVCYRETGDREALELARSLSRFLLKHSMWENTGPEGLPGNEHGIWAGHWHGNITTLFTLLRLALIDHDPRLEEIVREGYEQAVRNMVLRAGWAPMWTKPIEFNRPAWCSECTEVCGTADTVLLAVMLTDAGLGDYWDDVEAIVRNRLVEEQVTDIETLRKYSGNDPANDPLLRRFVGAFGGTMPTHKYGETWGCCTANGPMALYYAWHGITRFDGVVATVNLLLNRVSTWMDVESWLPYEGRLVMRNKQARMAQVRIPYWLDPEVINCFVDDQPAKPARAGRYFVFLDLRPDAVIRLEFPVAEHQDRYTLANREYTLTFRSSSVVDIAPRPTDLARPPILERAAMRQAKAPLRRVKCFIPDRVLPLP